MRRGAAASALGACLGALALQGALPGRSIVVDGETPANSSPPPDDPGWSHFCYVEGSPADAGSAVYIGHRSQRFPNGVLLTARHLFGAAGPGSLLFRCNGGARFRVKLERGVQRYEPLCVWLPGDALGSPGVAPSCVSPEVGNLAQISDIAMLEPELDPGLPDLELATRAPAEGAPMLMMGEGKRAGAAVAPCRYFGSPVSSGGYLAAGSADVPRWGRNRVLSGFTAVLDAGAGEAIPAAGDSGGPAFALDPVSGRWLLFGLAYSSAAASPEQSACIRDPGTIEGGTGATWSALYQAGLQLSARSRDSDSDGVPDFLDNCPTVPNPDQWNANQLPLTAVPRGDRFEYLWRHVAVDGALYGLQVDGATPPVAGNRCDGDFDESGDVALEDLRTIRACFGRRVPARGPAADPTCAEADMDGSGVVSVADLMLFGAVYGKNGQGM